MCVCVCVCVCVCMCTQVNKNIPSGSLSERQLVGLVSCTSVGCHRDQFQGIGSRGYLQLWDSVLFK